MNTTYKDDDEVTPLIPTPDIPETIRDTREPYKQKLALYLILASILCERIAFYSLANNLVPTLQSNQTVGWDVKHTTTVSFIFFGKSFLHKKLKNISFIMFFCHNRYTIHFNFIICCTV
jgi:hypothetical protein